MTCGASVPRAELRIAEEFSDGVAEIYSSRMLERVERAVRNLAEFPEMGSPLVRSSLLDQYGEGLRQVPIATFLIVYRYDGRTVDVLALVPGPSVV